jgi:hypothetical protein
MRLQDKNDRLKRRVNELTEELRKVYSALQSTPESLSYAVSRLHVEHEHFLTRESVIAERWREWSQLVDLERAEIRVLGHVSERASSSVAQATEKLKQLRHVIATATAPHASISADTFQLPQQGERGRGGEEDQSFSAVNVSLEPMQTSRGKGNRVIHSPFKSKDQSSVQLSPSTSFADQTLFANETTPQRIYPAPGQVDVPANDQSDYPRKWFEAYFDLGVEFIRQFWIQKQNRQYGTAFHDGSSATVLDVDPSDPLVQRSDVLLTLVSARKELLDLKASAIREGWTAAECKARSDAWFAGLKRSIAILDS